MPEPKKLHLRFEGHEGEIFHYAGEAPRLIKLGDNSLWQFEKFVEDVGKNYAHYIPAIVEELSWVRPHD